jgi:hypothetical protein
MQMREHTGHCPDGYGGFTGVSAHPPSGIRNWRGSWLERSAQMRRLTFVALLTAAPFFVLGSTPAAACGCCDCGCRTSGYYGGYYGGSGYYGYAYAPSYYGGYYGPSAYYSGYSYRPDTWGWRGYGYGGWGGRGYGYRAGWGGWGRRW